MTTDQTKALEILMEIGGNLDYDTQFAPLLRFVLEHGEEIPVGYIRFRKNGDRLEMYCSKCKNTICFCDFYDVPSAEFLVEEKTKQLNGTHCTCGAILTV